MKTDIDLLKSTAVAPVSPEARRQLARRKREEALNLSQARPLPVHTTNGEEEAFLQQHRTPVSSYSKGLPHNACGEVDLGAFRSLRSALSSGKPEDFEKIPLGTAQGRKLTNPQAGLAYDLEGPDAQAFTQLPAPRLDSPQNAAEMIELYWMALLRDVPFIQFESNGEVAAAAKELESYRDVLKTPRGTTLTPSTVFRGSTRGSVQGPLISQFLLRDIPYGSLRIPAKQETVLPNCDYLTDFASWLNIQNGEFPTRTDAIDTRQRRYIRSMWDMAHYVHVDALYEAYLNAALILLGEQADMDAGNPYRQSRNQMPFGTFGGPHILSLVTEVATRALKAVWFQKWFVHRRLRPEEFGGRVDVHRRKLAQYPIHAQLFSSEAHARILQRFGSSLLPQAFPEGSPMHPAYGAGHATVGGACVTILKAWFDTERALKGPVVVANPDGTELVPYTGSDAKALTVGGELDKLAANIAIGRSMGGVHWRSDYTESIRLGEKIALGLLQEQSILYNEQNSFSLVDFDGRTVQVSNGEILYTPTPLPSPLPRPAVTEPLAQRTA